MLILMLSKNHSMNKKEVLKSFIENDMGDILRDKLSPEEFKAVIQGIFMVMQEVASGNITTVYDAMDMANKFLKKPDCEGCKEVQQLTRLLDAQDKVISLSSGEAVMRIAKG